ncbi:spore coat protein, CotS family [Hathewaya proteolytica DSM 3090]|uniref:Spore coat protein, CotS family n=1 Tax=Hathewaya proteolytica DSM 3090 TaxID=1121331 RepID=A0A1M6PGC4_9CLOT|nr:CotS family spore coat protein [Hathewaya proteolytica]SHK06937.1 spore coat protein, CotS family [Hathewaya proteolytica DSM 3090]
MLESKYKEREFLSQYDLDIELFRRFNLDVVDVVPVRKVFVVVTSSREYILKRLDYGEDKIDFIYDALEYVKAHGFHRVINYVAGVDGKILQYYKGETYCVMELVDGRESSYTNPVEVSISAQGMAELHKASKGYNTVYDEFDNRNKLKDSFNKQIDEIMDIKDMVKHFSVKNQFDTLVVNNVDKFLEKAFLALSYLEKSNYNEIVKCQEKVALCHHDLAYHNILIKDNKANFIDFDYAIVDIKVHDVANYIMKVIKNFAFSFEKCQDIIDEYKKNYVLYDDEINLLYIMLLFPNRVFSLIKSYYYKEKQWEYNVFLNRLNEKFIMYGEEEEFLNKFKSRLL